MLLYLTLFTCQISKTATWALNAFTISLSLISIYISYRGIKLALKKAENEDRDKLATKEFVRDKIKALKESHELYEHSNEREHDQIRRSFEHQINYLDRRCDDNSHAGE